MDEGCHGKDGEDANICAEGDHILLWLEEQTRHLTKGEIRIGRINFHPRWEMGIVLFLRYVPGLTVPSSQNVPIVSLRVTKGIEVIASALRPVPSTIHELGFLYSVVSNCLLPTTRVALLSEKVAFTTVTLWSVIVGSLRKRLAVPLRLIEGARWESFPSLERVWGSEGGHNHDKVFAYQSCTGPSHMNQGRSI
jgi:hypothetical protein